ncbi:MAG: class I SAM-dependent methyltransferase [Nevskia sp.]|uniref:class I SAM-dependent methyltransferase n=1 Tax=Nevskia sp. TaxID=1929292 RepID=UPI004035A30B
MSKRLAASGGQPFNRQALNAWLASPRGKRLLAIEESELARVLPNLFRHCLQIGNWGGQRLLASADMLHRAVIGSFVDSGGGTQAVIHPESLPILDNSVDAVLLPHTLEFSPAPHNLLREVDRVLTDRGRLMIIGFNPWSLWGLRRLLGLGHRAFPRGARFHGTGRIGDWLELLDFEVTELRRFGVGFPWSAPSTAGEPFSLGSLVKPWMEGYLLVARKRVIPMTLVGKLARASVRPMVGRALGTAANTRAVDPDINAPAE